MGGISMLKVEYLRRQRLGNELASVSGSVGEDGKEGEGKMR